MKKIILILVALSLVFGPAVCWAASPWTSETTYGAKAKAKLDFGMKNLFGGWTELFTEPQDAHKEGKNVIVGVGKGLLNTVVYTGGGVLHAVTFFIPQIDVPLPDNGVNL